MMGIGGAELDWIAGLDAEPAQLGLARLGPAC
jgi:hypothetical protein